MGRHLGLCYYTLGQRQGLGIGGTKHGSEDPWFVAAKDPARNALVVVQGHEHPSLYRVNVDVEELHWIGGAPPDSATLARVGAKTRYRMADATCHVELGEDGTCRATFASPQWAPTPGQYLVLYDGDVCLGGGVITVPAEEGS